MQLDFEDLLATGDYLTITKLTRDIKVILETSFPSVWVQGEISNFTHHRSGHMYFSLKDEDAQISCIMWRSRNPELSFSPLDGMKVLVKARLTLFERRGAYQLDVWQMQLAGAGELQLAFEQLKRRLNEEGLFDEIYKKPLPVFPERIGIVTSPTGAAIHDLKSVLTRRFPGVEMILNPVRVQGEGAAAEIADAIDAFNTFGEVDVIIVTRGGGSLEDLWAFNEEVVARAIFSSGIPVVSAIGHEIDFSISDFVADFRASTPSAAAELVVRDRMEIKDRLADALETIANSILATVRDERERIKMIRRSYAFGQPLDFVRQACQRLDEVRGRMDRDVTHQIAIKRQIVTSMQKRLSLLEHQNVLKRGYSLCYRNADGRLVAEANLLKKRDKIRIEFHKGRVSGTVDEVLDP